MDPKEVITANQDANVQKIATSAKVETDTKKRIEMDTRNKSEIKNLWNATKGIKPTYTWLITNGMHRINTLKDSPLTDSMLLEKLCSDFTTFLDYLANDEKLKKRYLLKTIQVEDAEKLGEDGEPLVIVKTVKRETFTPIYVYSIISAITKVKR